MILATNPSPEVVTFTFEVSGLSGDAEIMWEDRPVQARHGTFRDAFEPMTVHVYRGRR